MADPKLCSVPNCGNKVLARGFCSKHWQRWRKHGTTDLSAGAALGSTCSVSGCERKPHTRWKNENPLCNMHWLRLYRVGSLELREKAFAAWRTCQVPGCDKEARTAVGALCEMHYCRRRRNGSFDPPQPYVTSIKRNPAGYAFIKDRQHPLAVKNGTVYVHRMVLYERLGEGTHQCHWCKIDVVWRGHGPHKLVADHLDGNKLNNEPHNLVASCHKCNSTRGLFQSWVMKHRDDPFLWALYETAKAA